MFLPLASGIRTTASEARLQSLLKERLAPGADRAAVDQRIWDLFGEEWTIMFTDLSGFSRGVAEFGIVHFLQIISESQRLLIPCIDAHDGILLKVEADSLMVLFRRPERGLDCAVGMQRVLAKYNVGIPETDRILLCVGLGFGRMLRIGDQDVFGAEVNAASKLGEDIARPGEILITPAVKERALSMPGLGFEHHPEIPPGATGAFRVTYTA